MASINANVQRLFISIGSFLAGSVRGQFGVDKATKQVLIHNDTDDTLVDTWSGDTKQVLLATTQTVTGDKTFTGAVNFDGAVDFDGTVDLTGATVVGLSGFVTIATDQTITGIKTIDNDFVIRDGNTLLLKDIGDVTTATIFNDGNRVVIDSVAAVRLNPTGSGVLDVTTSVTATGNNVTLNAISGAITSTSTAANTVNATDFDVNASGTVTVDATSDIALTSLNDIIMTATSTGTVAITATTIDASADAVNIDAVSGGMTINSTGADMNITADSDINMTVTGAALNVQAEGVGLNANVDVLLAAPDVNIQSAAITADMDNGDADVITTITNIDNTNASIINGAQLLFKLTQDVADGGASYDALKMLIEKAAAWTDPNLMESKITYQARVTDSITSFLIDFLNFESGLTTLGDGAGLSSITVDNDYAGGSAGAVTINAGSSTDGLYVNIGGSEQFHLIDGDASLTGAGLTLAAGTATLYPLSFLSGTNLTNALAGVMEYDGKTFYATPNSANRAAIASYHYRIYTAAVAYVNDTTTTQQWFTTLGAITLQASTTYLMEGQVAMDCGAGNHIVQIGFGGTATLTSINYTCINIRGAVNVVTTLLNKLRITTASLTNTQVAGTEDNNIQILGHVRINAGGTFIPQFRFQTGNPGAGTVAANSYIRLTPIGTDTVASVGDWS